MFQFFCRLVSFPASMTNNDLLKILSTKFLCRRSLDNLGTILVDEFFSVDDETGFG